MILVTGDPGIQSGSRRVFAPRSPLPNESRWSAARKFRIFRIFLSACPAKGSERQRPESAIGALRKLQSDGILTVGDIANVRTSHPAEVSDHLRATPQEIVRGRWPVSGRVPRGQPRCRPRPVPSDPFADAEPTPFRPGRSERATRRNVAQECKPAQRRSGAISLKSPVLDPRTSHPLPHAASTRISEW